MAKALAFDPDADILRGLSRGSRKTREQNLRKLMDRHAGHLHASATRLLKDPALAEDIVQQTFLKAWTKSEDWVPGSAKFSTWLTRVTINGCLDHLRKKNPQFGEDGLNLTDSRLGAEARMVRAEGLLALREAINTLPERQQMALNLATFDDLTQSEGAEAMGISEGAYESLLVRARRRLRETMMERQDAI
jgi:RNA polymerase sigma-70 factor (ECF subfamily)